jgi:hypothetical protein
MSKATGTASRKPQVFISYSGNDFDFADQLEKALLYGGFSITAGRHETLGLDAWQQSLGQLLDASEAVVCVLSPSSATNDICRWEFGFWLRRWSAAPRYRTHRGSRFSI